MFDQDFNRYNPIDILEDEKLSNVSNFNQIKLLLVIISFMCILQYSSLDLSFSEEFDPKTGNLFTIFPKNVCQSKYRFFLKNLPEYKFSKFSHRMLLWEKLTFEPKFSVANFYTLVETSGLEKRVCCFCLNLIL